MASAAIGSDASSALRDQGHGRLDLIARLYHDTCRGIAAWSGNHMAKRWTWSQENREKSKATTARRVARFDARVVDRIREMRAEGYSYRAIAAALDAAGHPPPGSRAYWQPSDWSHVAVMRIARRNGIA